MTTNSGAVVAGAAAGDKPHEGETSRKPEFVEDKPPSGGAGFPPVTPVERRWRWREMTRAAFSFSLLLLLALILIIILRKPAAEAKDLLGVVLAPLIGLVAAATGFYYGGDK